MYEKSARAYSPAELLSIKHASAHVELGLRLRKAFNERSELRDLMRRSANKQLTRIPEEARENSGDSDDYVPIKRVTARQLDGTDSEWKYRGRTESEETDPQPISAPSGLAAQKDEGFQRFYRAVVSPTHVRVTAGGRIVPNNRGSTSPTTKWAKEKVATDSTFSHQVPPRGSQPAQAPFPIPQGPFGPIPAIYPGFAPGIGPGMAPPPHPYALMPWQMGLNVGGNFAMPLGPGYPVPGAAQHLNKSKESPRSDKQSESGVSEKAHASYNPPTAPADRTQPMLYNGQWMIPGPGPFYPYGMQPPPGFPIAPFPMPMMPPPGMHVDHTARVDTARCSQSAENDTPEQTQGPAANASPGFGPPVNPPVSSIRPSEITKRHVEILKGRLRYYEDQLNYNKHQIDERAVQHDARTVRQYIDQFEKNLEFQLSMEETHYPQDRQKNDDDTPTSPLAGEFSKPYTAAISKSQIGVSESDDPQHLQNRPSGYRSYREKSTTRFASGINTTKSVSAFAGWKPPKRHADPDEMNGKSTLPVGAALAAPFQPRTDTSSAMANNSNSVQCRRVPDRETEVPYPEPTEDFLGEGRLDWEGFPPARDQGNIEMPYLVGRLPNGLRPDHAQDMDYIYERPLTEDELRARHMYWGKAPRHLQKGLPKYNGKDFFLPSPVKGRSSDEMSSSARLTDQRHAGRTEFERSVVGVKADSDPFLLLGQSGQILSRNGPGHSTQSESLPRQAESSAESVAITTNRSVHYGMRVGRSLDELNKASNETPRTSTDSVKDKSSSDEGDDDPEIIFTGRRTMGRTTRSHNDIWSRMLKKGKTSATAVPGTISSMTAQGVLPHYSGHATASLTPTIVNKAASPRGSGIKSVELADSKFASSISPKRGEENFPPTNTALNNIC